MKNSFKFFTHPFIPLISALILCGCSNTPANPAETTNDTTQTTPYTITEMTREPIPVRVPNEMVVTEDEVPPYEEQPVPEYEYTYVNYEMTNNYMGTPVNSIPDNIRKEVIRYFETTPYYKMSKNTINYCTEEDCQRFLGMTREIKPEITAVYEEDFMGNSVNSQFFVLEIPYTENGKDYAVYSFVLYRCYDGTKSVVATYKNIADVKLLDYGIEKQLLITGTTNTTNGGCVHIIGVLNKQPEILYYITNIAGDTEAYHINNDISLVYGDKNRGLIVHYNTKKHDYEQLKAKKLEKDAIKKLAGTYQIPELIKDGNKLNRAYSVVSIADKYYILTSDTNTVTYKKSDKTYTKVEDGSIPLVYYKTT